MLKKTQSNAQDDKNTAHKINYTVISSVVEKTFYKFVG